MTSEELTGTLQSRGQEEGVSYVVIDSQRFTVPEYVLDWMAKMQKPLQNGETVLYKKQQDREGGEWALTKIRRPSKVGGKSTPGPASTPVVDQKSGILISHYATGCTVRMENGDKTYALQSRLPEIELPQRIDFTVDKQGFVRSYTFRGKVNPEGFTPAAQILKDNLDRMNGPADGETVEPPGGELINAPAALQGKPDTTPDKDRAYRWDLTIGGTVNLQNYENLKLEISGPACDRDQMIAYLGETLDLFGKGNPATREQIEGYKRRVL